MIPFRVLINKCKQCTMTLCLIPKFNSMSASLFHYLPTDFQVRKGDNHVTNDVILHGQHSLCTGLKHLVPVISSSLSCRNKIMKTNLYICLNLRTQNCFSKLVSCTVIFSLTTGQMYYSCHIHKQFFMMLQHC